MGLHGLALHVDSLLCVFENEVEFLVEAHELGGEVASVIADHVDGLLLFDEELEVLGGHNISYSLFRQN